MKKLLLAGILLLIPLSIFAKKTMMSREDDRVILQEAITHSDDNFQSNRELIAGTTTAIDGKIDQEKIDRQNNFNALAISSGIEKARTDTLWLYYSTTTTQKIKVTSTVDYVAYTTATTLGAVQFTTVTTCGLPIPANSTDTFRFQLIVQSTNTGIGIFASVSYDVAPAEIYFITTTPIGVNTAVPIQRAGRSQFQGATGTAVDVANANLLIEITGIVKTNAAITLYPVFCGELNIGTGPKVTVKKGSVGMAETDK
jgi:hypothetical protein